MTMNYKNVKTLNRILMILMLSLWCGAAARSQTRCGTVSDNLECREQKLDLAGTPIQIRVYEKKPAVDNPATKIDRTFVVVHNNEQKGLAAAKKVISENYGRLVEVVSNYEDSFKLNDEDKRDKNEKRYLYFGNGSYCIDPNRIYSEKGIRDKLSICERIPDAKISAIYAFGKELIKIVTNNNTHKFVIGVHNNTINGGLSINSWTDNPEEFRTAVGIFKTPKLFNGGRTSEDDFILVTNSSLFYQFFNPKTPLNIALQQDRNALTERVGGTRRKLREDLDDGSMSLYFGTTLFGNTGKPFSYINIEAGGKDDDGGNSKNWQKEIIKTVITRIKP